MTLPEAHKLTRSQAGQDELGPLAGNEFPDPTHFGNLDFRQVTRTVHDLGGETGGPIQLQEREPMAWETNTFVTCECLAWRGVWNHTEKLRRVVDLGEKQYFALPYAGRFLLSISRALVDKRLVTLTELTNKIEEVKKRYAGY